MRVAEVILGAVPLRLLVPETEQERRVGLSRGLAPGYDGMVFTFSPPSIARMTMRYTALDLQIAFVSSDVVREVRRAPAHSGEWSSSGRCERVIEMPRHGALRIQPGMKLSQRSQR